MSVVYTVNILCAHCIMSVVGVYFKFGPTMDTKTVCVRSIDGVNSDIAFPVFMQGLSCAVSLPFSLPPAPSPPSLCHYVIIHLNNTTCYMNML